MPIRIVNRPPRAIRHIPYAAALLLFAGCGALLAAIPASQDPAPNPTHARIVAFR